MCFLSFGQNDALIASMGQRAAQWALLLENACSACAPSLTWNDGSQQVAQQIHRQSKLMQKTHAVVEFRRAEFGMSFLLEELTEYG